MSCIGLTNCFFKFQGTVTNLGNKWTLFQIIVCETFVIKIYTFSKILSFLIMQVGNIYFINHKTKDYFPEGAGLLNLSVSTLNE